MNNEENGKKELVYGKQSEIVTQKSRTTPIFKGRKISQFHVDYVKNLLDKIMNGELNTQEVLKLLEKASIENDETIIKDAGSIKRIVCLLLEDKPEELKKYNEVVKRNTGKRSPYGGKIGKPKLGTYHEEEKNLKNEIINVYLPQIILGDVTIDMLEKQLNCSHHTIDKIIVEYYTQIGDDTGIENYKKAKTRNIGASLETRQSAKKMRIEVKDSKVVSNAEFLLLSPEEQEKQLVVKIRKEQLKEEKSKNDRKETSQTIVLTEDTTINRINKIMEYFKSKNRDENNIIFSDEDIRYMIFRYPTLIRRSKENLDKKFDVLTSYKDIDELTAYDMVKTFPAVIGYGDERIKKQLDLLEKENLMDYIISKPSGLMRSVDLMYALIQYAKERHKTNDLSNINRSNIFMANPTLKRLYGTTGDELKKRFPYDIVENNDSVHNNYVDDDLPYVISGDLLGQIKPNISKLDEAKKILSEAIRDEFSKDEGEKNVE